MFKSASEIAKSNGGCRSKGDSLYSNNIVLGVSSLKNSRNKQLSFAIGCGLAKAARLYPSDRVDVLFDPVSRKGLIKRVIDGGYSATARSIKKSKIKTGQFYTLSVKMTRYSGMPDLDKSRAMLEEKVTDEGIEFSFPSCVTFE